VRDKGRQGAGRFRRGTGLGMVTVGKYLGGRCQGIRNNEGKTQFAGRLTNSSSTIIRRIRFF